MHPIDMVAHRMTSSLFIDELRVHDSARIGAVGEGLACLMKGFVIRRVLAAAEAIGNARFLLDQSIEYAKTRKTFGQLIGVNQGIQYPLVQAYAKVEAADLMRWDVLDLVDAWQGSGAALCHGQGSGFRGGVGDDPGCAHDLRRLGPRFRVPRRAKAS